MKNMCIAGVSRFALVPGKVLGGLKLLAPRAALLRHNNKAAVCGALAAATRLRQDAAGAAQLVESTGKVPPVGHGSAKDVKVDVEVEVAQGLGHAAVDACLMV